MDEKDRRIAELQRNVTELKERLALAEGADKCEACGKIIEPGEPRHDWNEGVTTCMKCGGPDAKEGQ